MAELYESLLATRPPVKQTSILKLRWLQETLICSKGHIQDYLYDHPQIQLVPKQLILVQQWWKFKLSQQAHLHINTVAMQSPGPNPPVCCSLQYLISQSRVPESTFATWHFGLMTPKTRLYFSTRRFLGRADQRLQTGCSAQPLEDSISHQVDLVSHHPEHGIEEITCCGL